MSPLKVEIELPPDVRNWHMMADALATYPIRILEPGDVQSVHVAVTM